MEDRYYRNHPGFDYSGFFNPNATCEDDLFTDDVRLGWMQTVVVLPEDGLDLSGIQITSPWWTQYHTLPGYFTP